MAFVSLTAFGQDQVFTTPPTTEEEYNFLTKGYKIQVESGLDMKKGYLMVDLGEVKDGSCSFKFKVLERESSEEAAGILVIAKEETWSGVSTYYLCIPLNSPELYKRYNDALGPWDCTLTKSYAKVLSAYFAHSFLATVEATQQAEE